MTGKGTKEKEMREIKEIKISGFHYGEHQDLEESLTNKGFNSRIVRGGIVINLKKVDSLELAEIEGRFEQEKPEDPDKSGWDKDFYHDILFFIRTIEVANQDRGGIKEKFRFLIGSSQWIYEKGYNRRDRYTTWYSLKEMKLKTQDVPTVIREYADWYRNKKMMEKEAVEKPKFLIPNSINMQLRMELVEEGGSTASGGSATIICGRRGQAFRPYWVPKSGSLSNGIHAYFSIPQVAVLARGSQGYHGEKIYLIQCSIVQKRNRCWIEQKEIWSGQPNELPGILSCFHSAIKAVMKKCYDYHCRSTYYVI